MSTGSWCRRHWRSTAAGCWYAAAKPRRSRGTWSPSRFVVLEFDSVEQAKRWWGSPEYAAAKALRQRAAKTEMIVVEGVAR
ncbi:MAG: DUF1330 domain-containing protein [Terriglobales bacterium]